jgi:hypothetical protein
VVGNPCFRGAWCLHLVLRNVNNILPQHYTVPLFNQFTPHIISVYQSPVYDRLNIEIAGSNPARSMDVRLRVSVLCCPVFR